MLQPIARNFKRSKKRIAWAVYQRKALLSANAFHATSVDEGEELRRIGFRQPIFIIPNGVDIENKVDASHPPVEERRTALYLGRIHPIKGLPLLLNAWSKSKPRGWKLRIVGPDEGGHRQELETIARDLSLDDSCTFEEALDDKEKRKAYQNASLFILPTHSENFGIVVAEALANGVPVLTTHGAPWEVLRQQQCGWWVPVTEAAITTAILEATSLSISVLQSMGDKGRELIERDFGWEKIAAQMLASYKWLLGEGEKPDCVYV